jgi:hypothetical protein
MFTERLQLLSSRTAPFAKVDRLNATTNNTAVKKRKSREKRKITTRLNKTDDFVSVRRRTVSN